MLKNPDELKLDVEKLIGLTQEEATAIVKEAGFIVRICDEQFVFVTAIYHPDRVTLCLENGIVVDADIG